VLTYDYYDKPSLSQTFLCFELVLVYKLEKVEKDFEIHCAQGTIKLEDLIQPGQKKVMLF